MRQWIRKTEGLPRRSKVPALVEAHECMNWDRHQNMSVQVFSRGSPQWEIRFLDWPQTRHWWAGALKGCWVERDAVVPCFIDSSSHLYYKILIIQKKLSLPSVLQRMELWFIEGYAHPVTPLHRLGGGSAGPFGPSLHSSTATHCLCVCFTSLTSTEKKEGHACSVPIRGQLCSLCSVT